MANRYWVGGTGNWDAVSTVHWAAVSGGAGGQSVPTAADNVFFDGNSGNQVVTITAPAFCLNFSCPTYNGQIAGASPLTISGSFTTTNNFPAYTGTLTFNSTVAGNTFSMTAAIPCAMTFNGVGGVWTLQTNLNISQAAATNVVTLTNGTLNTNGQTVTCYQFLSSNANVRTITLGASTINCILWTCTTSTNLTLNANTSSITIAASGGGFSGGGKTYNQLNFTQNGSTGTIDGANTFSSINLSNTAIINSKFVISANQTITGTLSVSGNSAVNRIWIASSVLGTARTLTAALKSLANVDFQDITAAGAASPFSGASIGNALGNTNITFTPAVTRYWVATSGGNWNTTASWSTVSGGVSGASVPLCHDTVIFNANSITSAARTISANVQLLGAGINFTGMLNNPTLNLGTNTKYIFGNLTLIAGMTIDNNSGTLSFQNRDPSAVFTTGGITINHPINIQCFGGAITISGNLVMGTTRTLTVTHGNFNTNGFDVTCGLFSSSNSFVRSVTMDTSTFTLTGTGTVWSMATTVNLTLNPGTSTIIINDASAVNKTFAGGGKTYNDLTFTGAGTGNLTISGSNTINTFTVSTAPKTVVFNGGTTQTLTTLSANGSVGNLITFISTVAGTKWITGANNANVSYVAVQDATGLGPAAPYNDSVGGVDNGNNSGWRFTSSGSNFFF